jgi:hypothetical protein
METLIALYDDGSVVIGCVDPEVFLGAAIANGLSLASWKRFGEYGYPVGYTAAQAAISDLYYTFAMRRTQAD